jgi:monoamine oxidase
MALGRTRLFTRLSKLVTGVLRERGLRNANGGGGPLESGRRELLAFTALGSASALLPACEADDGYVPPEPTPEVTRVRVAVIGAGLAGLHAARRLQQAAVDVIVYEASNRVGGRTFTLRGEFPDDQIAEMGGELVDSNHVAMHALVDELGLTLDDRLAEPSETPEIWWIDGSAVAEDTIVEQFSAVAERMLEDLESADEDEDAYTELDETTLADYLEEVVPGDTYPELHAVLESAYRGEFGLEIAEQSALNLIYLIGSDEPDPFRIFGESDERYHIHEGSDAVAAGLSAALGERVKLGRRLTALREDSDGFFLELATGASTESVRAEHVILALPFSTLRDVTIDAAFSDEKQDIIATLGYGTNTKVMGAFKQRIWLTEHDSAGAVTGDAAFQQVWDTSIGQDGEHGILTNFLGGETGERGGSDDPESWFQGVAEALEAVFPGIAAEYVAGSARRMHWPTAPNAKGSYTCYLPGQWSFWGLEGVREGNVHFAGEHTSLDFQGWMEGAAETGAFAAAEVLNDLGIAYPSELAELLAEKLPQPTWGLGEEAEEKRRKPLTRRRRLRAGASAPRAMR